MTTRPKILCLGVSYADIPAVVANGCASKHETKHAATAVSKTQHEQQQQQQQQQGNASCGTDRCRRGALTAEDAIRCVQEKLLNQMDGRDLTRVLATEELCQVDVYCVSQEKGTIYRPDRHLDSNFNRPSLVQRLQTAFCPDIQFHQIILDYFWIPTGWDVHHWSRHFFESVLLSFAKSKLILPHGSSSSSFSPTTTELYRAGVYLPFCFHCFQAVVTYAAKLTTLYNISFIRKTELHCITLWAGTQTIHRQQMQHVLGKRIDQEEVYCTFTSRHVKEMGCSAVGASKEDLIHIASSLEDFADVRFIVLEPLHISDPTHPHFIRGRFLGLTDPHCVQRGWSSAEKVVSMSPHRSIRSQQHSRSSFTTSSSLSSGAARKRTLSPSRFSSPRKSPRLQLHRPSPDSVLPISPLSSSLRPKVLFPPK